MKKLLSILIICAMAVTCFISCDSGDKSGNDIKNLYADMISSYNTTVDGVVTGNTMFGSGEFKNTIVVNYTIADVNTKLDAVYDSSMQNDKVALRFKGLDVLQQILIYTFSYYETWNESFYSQVAGDCEQAELNTLYKKLNDLKSQVGVLYSARVSFEGELEGVFGTDSFPNTTITLYTYQYNMLIEKSLDFVNYFRTLHEKYLFENNTEITTDATLSENSLSQIVSANYLDLVNFVYYSNFKIFNSSLGDNGICDLYYLMNLYVTNPTSDLIVFDDILSPTSELNNSLVSMVNDPELLDDTLIIVNRIKYYINSFKQNLKIYKELYDDLDNYSLSQYRYGAITSPTEEEYITRFSVKESASYTFMNNMVRYIYPEFTSVMLELV